MSTFLDKMNLRPQERRLVVGVAAGIFLILNYYLVFPYFSEWGKVRGQMAANEQKIMTYQTEIQNDAATNGYRAILAKLDKDGPGVQLEGDVQLLKTVQSKVGKVAVNNYSPVTTTKSSQTNALFEEQSMSITVDSEEKDLIDFLYAIGGDSSMVRVRDMNLKPADAQRYRLKGTVTLTAVYQKKPEVKATTSTNKPPTTGRPTLVPAAKPAQSPGAPKSAK